MVDALMRYVEDQLAKGYAPSAVKDVLVRQGYSPALVDGVMESVNAKKGAMGVQQPASQAASNSTSVLPKLVIGFLVLGLIVIGAVFVPGLMKPKQPLLDVKTAADKTSYAPGEDVSFTLEVFNMGSKDRFDITLTYRILDPYDNLVTSNEETIAISTSTSYHKKVRLPADTSPGTYTLRVFADYEGKKAMASFSFKAEGKAAVDTEKPATNTTKPSEKPAETPIIPVEKGTCRDGLLNQDETNIDCEGVCGGYWYDSGCHSTPEETGTTTTTTPETPKKRTVASIIIEVRTKAKTDPAAAEALCEELEKPLDKDRCYKGIAEITLDKKYCELVQDIDSKDTCYYLFFMQGDYEVCDKLFLPENKKACEQMKMINEMSEQMQALEENSTSSPAES